MNNILVMPNWIVIAPEIFLLICACLAMLVDVFAKRRILTYLVAQAGLLGALLLTIYQYFHFNQPLICLGGEYVYDRLAILTRSFVLLTSIFAFIYARQYLKGRHVAGAEYYILGLFSILGMLVMVAGASFLTIYLGLELLSLALYAMIALDKTSGRAVEAAMKYFVMGAMASGLLLFGISLVYGATGSISLAEIGTLLPAASPAATSLALAGMVFILVGLLFKFGAVPFHMWVPDIYEGSPTCITLFIACAPKIATFCIATRILAVGLPLTAVHWTQGLIAVAILSMFAGNILAIAQTNLKRMLAYSSIAHMGYMLLGLVAGPASTYGYTAALFYIVTYVLVAAGAFAVIALLAHEGAEFDQLSDFRGLNARSPWLAFLMLLLMFSMAGVPPTVGFFAKLGILETLVQAHFVWLAALALLSAIIGAYYYLKVVMLMYFEEPDQHVSHRKLALTRGSMAAVTINAFAALLLGLFPSNLIDLCQIYFK